MKKITLLLFAIALIVSYSLTAQVAINADGSNSEGSAMLDVKSNNKGFLPPRMTKAERDAISSPVDGLVIFNTTSNCLNFYSWGFWYETCGTPDVTTVHNPTTNKTWMDRNLGASQVATSSTDAAAYGYLYQWGRATEGHQIRTGGGILTNASTAVPNDGNSWDGLFILETITPYDWLIPQEDALWQGESGTNNPCPKGFRIPTVGEWDAERLSWSTNNAAGAYNSPLKIVAGGYRSLINGTVYADGVHGVYWSRTVSGTDAYALEFSITGSATMDSNNRANGFSIRCIKD